MRRDQAPGGQRQVGHRTPADPRMGGLSSFATRGQLGEHGGTPTVGANRASRARLPMSFLSNAVRAEYRGGHRIHLWFNDGRESQVDFGASHLSPVFDAYSRSEEQQRMSNRDVAFLSFKLRFGSTLAARRSRNTRRILLSCLGVSTSRSANSVQGASGRVHSRRRHDPGSRASTTWSARSTVRRGRSTAERRGSRRAGSHRPAGSRLPGTGGAPATG